MRQFLFAAHWLFVAVLPWSISLCSVGCHESTTRWIGTRSTDAAGCTAAIPITFTNNVFSFNDTLDTRQDAAYFQVRPSIDDWLLLTTDNEDISGPTFDAVISILSADGKTRLATVDNSMVWNSSDVFFMYHFASTQPVCIKVESFEGWTNTRTTDNTLSSNLQYAITLALNPKDTHKYDQLPDNTVDQSSEIQYMSLTSYADGTGTYGWINGLLNFTNDEDLFAFTTPAETSFVEIFAAMSDGAGIPELGVSATGTTARVTLQLLHESLQPIAQTELSVERASLFAILEPSTNYFVRVLGASDWSPGVNDFYSLLLTNESLNSFEHEIAEPNDTRSQAEAINLRVQSPGETTGQMIGTINSESDVDIFQLALLEEQYVLLRCSGATGGSSLTDFTVSLLDPDGNLLQQTVESTLPVEWSSSASATGFPVQISTSDTYYIQVSAGVLDPSASRCYDCNFLIISP